MSVITFTTSIDAFIPSDYSASGFFNLSGSILQSPVIISAIGFLVVLVVAPYVVNQFKKFF